MSDFHDLLRAGASRRAVVSGALAAGAHLATRSLPVWAQQMQTYLPPGVAPKPKGPVVFRDYDKEELDYVYNNRPWVPNRDELVAQWDKLSAETRSRLGPPRRLTYGTSEKEYLDLYATEVAHAPIHVFIHGGSWRFYDTTSFHFLAEGFVGSGAHFIVIDFTNVVDTMGDLVPLAVQVRKAVAWVYENATSFDGDPNQIYISGHSSGGHLAGVVLTTDWQNDFGLPEDLVKGGLCASGMYDLYPVSLSARNTYANFTDEVIGSLSPIRHLDKLVAPVIVSNGSLETPEFLRQGRHFADAARAAGRSVNYLVGQGCNHFNVINTLATPDGLLGQAALEQMNLLHA